MPTVISIIVPVYNEEQTVVPLLERLLRVSMPADREVLVVNDGSTDRRCRIGLPAAPAAVSLPSVFEPTRLPGAGPPLESPAQGAAPAPPQSCRSPFENA